MTLTSPSWISIDSASGNLTILSPEVSSDTEFYFIVKADVSGTSNPIQKIITLTVLNCVPSNCQKCLSSSNTTCEICNLGYNLASGACNVHTSNEASTTAKALSTTSKICVGLIISIVALTSLVNVSSMACIWMTINQLQLFLIIL